MDPLRIVTFAPVGGGAARPGALVDEIVVDLNAAARAEVDTLDRHADPFGADASALVEQVAGRGWDDVRGLVTRVIDAPEVSARIPRADVRLLPALPRPRKIICTGMNFRKLLETSERDLKAPSEPKAFLKSTNTLIGPYDDVPHPAVTQRLDYEVELGIVIGRRCKHVAPADVAGVIAGYVVLNDFSARDIQYAEMDAGLLFLGKNLDGLCPLGPWLLTDIGIAPDEWRLTLEVNGERRQEAVIGDMLYGIAELVSYFSMITLEPGDVITSGTPAGVASSLEGVRYLEPGDVVRTAVDGVGCLENRIAPDPLPAWPAREVR